ncbi:hypothetical protein BsWGS_00871 [Bradybaena similaris]
MKKAMFHKFSNFLQQAVDTFASNVSPQEEFVYHWKSVTSYFVDSKGRDARIEETDLQQHLVSMLRIIQEEESNLGDAGTTGVCLEYLLQHRLLETLYTLGRTDHPPGMKQTVLSFFTKLVSRISHPLLPHINVHRAVQRLVKACGETQGSPTEKEEIEFLCTVCAKIKTDPYLVNFFIENPDKGIIRNPHRPPQVFSLVDALLSLSSSEDARISVKACEGLMLCASLPEKSAATALISHTCFCQSIANTLIQLYQRLPALISPDVVESVEAKWGFGNIIDRNEKQGVSGRCQVISFFSWLDYCDQLISVANPLVGEALASEIHRTLLTGQIAPQLMQTSESGTIVSTTYITRCLRTVCSPALLKEFCYFLLGSDRTLEVQNSPEHALKKRLLERCNHLSEEVCLATLKLFDTLLQKEDEHIFHCLLLRNLLGRSYLQESPPTEDSSPQISIGDNVGQEIGKEYSQQELAPNANKVIIDIPQTNAADASTTTVVDSGQHGSSNPEQKTEAADVDLKNNSGSLTADECSVEPAVEVDGHHIKDLFSQNEQTFARELVNSSACKEGDGKDNSSPGSSDSSNVSSSGASVSSSLPSGFPSPMFIRSEVHKVVNSFLGLLPEEAKSSYQTPDSGYDMYIRDAHKQFAIQETVCNNWAWSKRPEVTAEYVMDTFYEGSFLHMLFDKLAHLLDQSYSVNLLLTAIIAKVALLPHPNLDEFLLDPFLPTLEGTRTLYSVLVKVTNEIRQHQKLDAAFSQKLILARKQLLGIVPTIHRHYQWSSQLT